MFFLIEWLDRAKSVKVFRSALKHLNKVREENINIGEWEEAEEQKTAICEYEKETSNTSYMCGFSWTSLGISKMKYLTTSEEMAWLILQIFGIKIDNLSKKNYDNYGVSLKSNEYWT